jgi:hypothetical protein
MKYIDAEKLKAEIKRQMKFYDEKEMKAWDDSEQGDEDALWYQGHRKMCAKLLAIITSLQQEQPEEDLEKEMYNKATSECDIIWNEMGFQLCYDNLIEAFVAGAEWAMKRKEGKK